MAAKNIGNSKAADVPAAKPHLIFPEGEQLPTECERTGCRGPIYHGEFMVLNESFAASGDVAADLELLPGETLVEILRIWDCDEQCWAASLPIVIRMEVDDLTIWTDSSNRLCTYLGSVRTELSVLASRPGATTNPDKPNPTICWLPDRGYKSFSGSLIEGASFFHDAEHGVSVITLSLDSGWCINVFSAPKRAGLLDLQAQLPPKQMR